MAVGLAWLVCCHSVSALADQQSPSTPASFDQFIDQTTGDEMPQKVVAANTAYRAKRVYKSIFRWIDRQGYYFDFIKRFQQWCDTNSGRYVRNQEMDADCFDRKNGDVWLGAYSIKIVTTAQYGGDMTAGHATFYFFRQQEIEALRKAQLARDEQAQNLAIEREIATFNEKTAARKKALIDQSIVKRVGQKICRTVGGVGQFSSLLINGKQVRPQYVLSAFTENGANDKIQLRIAAIREELPSGFSNMPRLLLDGDIVLQNNTVIWDDPLLWHPCD
jgi:hypothetical protein